MDKYHHDLKAAYYVPTIPDVFSTDRYQHSLALIEYFEECHLISNNPVPKSLTKNTTSTTVLTESGVLALGRAASVEASRRVEDGIFLTSPHFETGIAGSITALGGSKSPTWVADVYETPAQYRLNNPCSTYQITARGLAGIMKLAPHGIHSVHPDTPYQYGRERTFVNNGAPVSRVTPSYSRSEPIHIVWVGSARLDRGGRLLVNALHQTDSAVKIGIYGEEHENLLKQLDGVPSKHTITHYGWSDHQLCLQATAEADVAYCVLPPRTDWRYAPPIKVGEALAGGTVPLLSDFPGNRQLAADAGEYVDPDANAIAERINRLAMISDSDFRIKSRAARARGEEVSWSRIRREFSRKVATSLPI